MTKATWAMLRALLVDRYSEFKHRLARRLGSADLAAETLQETWLRLERPGDPGVLRRPDAYLYRIALNVAADRRDADRRRLAWSEVEMLRHLDDDELDPERIVGSRSEIAALAHALDELPPRCRAILIAARLNETPHKLIAARHGISTRMVERELKRALDHCGERLGRISPRRFGLPPSEPSIQYRGSQNSVEARIGGPIPSSTRGDSI
jgi:RNA polymerase sigma-70 factor (ECF subfamily)